MTRLVAYGCSHTGGNELADHIVLKQPREKVDIVKSSYGQGNWDKIFDYFGFDSDPMDEMEFDIFRYIDITRIEELHCGEDLNRSLSWVRYLAEMRGFSHYKNRGYGGASLEHCLFFLENDLMNREVSLDLDEIIVQVPHPYRWLSFKHDGEFTTLRPTQLFSLPIGSDGTTYGTKPDINSFQTHELNIYNITWRYYKSMKQLKQLGGNFFFIEKTPEDIKNDLYLDCDETPSFEWVEYCWNWIIENCIKTGCYYDTDDKHGWGHYGTDVHYDIARDLNDKLGN